MTCTPGATFRTEDAKAMNHKFAAFIFAGLLLIGTGCDRRTSSPTAGPVTFSAGGGGTSNYSVSLPMMAFADLTARRFIAERHKLEIITPEAEIQRSWESVVAFCGTIQCEVVTSSITTRTGDSVPSGTMSLRVAPEDLKKLLAHVQKLGNIAQHTTEREDKTAAVVDTDAKLKNLTNFRDSLRAMLAKPSATVKDVVEIQQQLTEAQSELDSETAQRKILANETEKIAVEISFRVEKSSGNAGGFAQIWNALRESGSVLGDSTASLITVIVSIIPWLILIVPAVWLLARAWRKVRRNRIASPPPSPAAP